MTYRKTKRSPPPPFPYEKEKRQEQEGGKKARPKYGGRTKRRKERTGVEGNTTESASEGRDMRAEKILPKSD